MYESKPSKPPASSRYAGSHVIACRWSCPGGIYAPLLHRSFHRRTFLKVPHNQSPTTLNTAVQPKPNYIRTLVYNLAVSDTSNYLQLQQCLNSMRRDEETSPPQAGEIRQTSSDAGEHEGVLTAPQSSRFTYEVSEGKTFSLNVSLETTPQGRFHGTIRYNHSIPCPPHELDETEDPLPGRLRRSWKSTGVNEGIVDAPCWSHVVKEGTETTHFGDDLALALKGRFRNFTRLPLELREMVYGFAHAEWKGGPENSNQIVDLNHQVKGLGIYAWCPPFLPAICYANKQLYREAVPIFIAARTFVFRCYVTSSYLCRFLDSMENGKGWISVKGVRCTPCYASEQKGDVYPNVLLKCRTLKFVSFSLSVIQITNPNLPAPHRLMSAEELVKFYGFDAVLNCETLQEIQLHCSDGVVFRDYCQCDPMDALRALGEWIQARFLERGRAVKFTVSDDVGQ